MFLSRPARWSGFASLIWVVIAGAAGAVGPAAPADTLTPREVVAAQLEALRENTPAGLARVFAFASPANQAVTGPSARFAQMLRAAYPELLGHRSAHYGELLIEDGAAAQAVEIIAADGHGHRYVFMLSKQAGGDCTGCWLTDGVVNASEDSGLAI